MKIESLTKNDSYTTVTFTDGFHVYGVLITKVTNTVEFMKWGLTDEEPTVIDETSHPEELKELKDKYLPRLLDYIEKH